MNPMMVFSNGHFNDRHCLKWGFYRSADWLIGGMATFYPAAIVFTVDSDSAFVHLQPTEIHIADCPRSFITTFIIR